MSATSLDPLYKLPKSAAVYIAEHGWTQGAEVDADGRVCLTGALRLCSPVPGDSYLARAVLRRRGRAEDWNDRRGRTAGEVIGYLAETEISDDDLALTFGPQWREIVDQVRAISGATPAQIKRLDAAWDAAGALSVRDLISEDGFTQEHYDILTGPWRKAIGPLHADDAPLSGVTA